jgi:ribosomal protein S8
MSNPITIQLPPDLEQHMLQEAQRQNTTLEKLIIQSIQKDYGQISGTQTQANHSLEDFFITLRDSRQTGQATVQIPVSELSLEMSKSLKRSGILLDFQVSGQQLTLHINPTPPQSPIGLSPYDIDTSKLDPEAATMVEALKDEDENIRFQAIQDLTQWYKRQAV